jgi:hypothetical protein
MQQTAYACDKLRQVNWHRHELANPFSVSGEFWPRREPMSRHGGYLGWHRTDDNRGCRHPSVFAPFAIPEKSPIGGFCITT